MTGVVSTRLEEKERIDRSSLMRKFLLTQIEEYRLKEVSEKYRKGIVSLAEATVLVKVSIYKMMEYVEREKIQASPLSYSEMEVELERSKKIFDEKNL